MDPADLLPFNQALVEMLGELTSPFAYWQNLALARVCGGNGGGGGRGGFLCGCEKTAQMTEQNKVMVLL